MSELQKYINFSTSNFYSNLYLFLSCMIFCLESLNHHFFNPPVNMIMFLIHTMVFKLTSMFIILFTLNSFQLLDCPGIIFHILECSSFLSSLSIKNTLRSFKNIHKCLTSLSKLQINISRDGNQGLAFKKEERWKLLVILMGILS